MQGALFLQTQKETAMTQEKLKQILDDNGYGSTVLFENPDYADALVGVTTSGRAVYDYGRMIDCLIADGMTPQDAVEFIDYNSVGSLHDGSDLPVVMHGLSDMLAL